LFILLLRQGSGFSADAEALVLSFEELETLSHRGEEMGQLFFGVARGDVLLAVPVECFDVNDDGALGGSSFSWNAECFKHGCGIGVPFEDFGAAEDFESALGGIVHEEKGDAVVVFEVAAADVLLVATQVGEGDGLRIQDVQEAL
jgi:hypothetical protein